MPKFSVEEDQAKDMASLKVEFSKKVNEILSAFQNKKIARSEAQVQICELVEKLGRWM